MPAERMKPRGSERDEEAAVGPDEAAHRAQDVRGIRVMLEAVDGHDDVRLLIGVEREDAAVGHTGGVRLFPRRFQDVPTVSAETFDEDVDWELERLRAAGLRSVVAVQLTKPEFGVPVTRIVIPGLEAPEEKIPDYLYGARARAVLEVEA